mmetsp:Transcript_6267/g.14396  ORF Transcript_6267/g.14396 Transcript_6267/m.14396 type:complete len:240 (+) Transcript_6267:389-1108(+)
MAEEPSRLKVHLSPAATIRSTVAPYHTPLKRTWTLLPLLSASPSHPGTASSEEIAPPAELRRFRPPAKPEARPGRGLFPATPRPPPQPPPWRSPAPAAAPPLKGRVHSLWAAACLRAGRDSSKMNECSLLATKRSGYLRWVTPPGIVSRMSQVPSPCMKVTKPWPPIRYAKPGSVCACTSTSSPARIGEAALSKIEVPGSSATTDASPAAVVAAAEAASVTAAEAAVAAVVPADVAGPA